MSLPRTFAVAVVLLAASMVQAQPWRLGGPRPGARIEELRKVRLIEMLDLKEDQSVRFFARLHDHESAMQDLKKQRSDALDKIERLVRNHADEKEYAQVFPDVEAVDVKLVEERHKFFEGLTDILSQEQMGKYLLFDRYFEKELREAMREIQERRHGPETP